MKTCLLVKTKIGKQNDVAGELSKIRGVKLAFPVYGRADVAVNVEVKDTLELRDLILSLLKINGYAGCESLIEMEV